MRTRHLAVMLLGIALAACGSSSKVTKPIEQAAEIGPVKFRVAATDPTRVLGASTVSSYNVMAVGGEDDIPRMHAEEIAKFLAGELERRRKK